MDERAGYLGMDMPEITGMGYGAGVTGRRLPERQEGKGR